MDSREKKRYSGKWCSGEECSGEVCYSNSGCQWGGSGGIVHVRIAERAHQVAPPVVGGDPVACGWMREVRERGVEENWKNFGRYVQEKSIEIGGV